VKRVALVTGASGGIGSAICLRLAKEGYSLAVHYNSSKAKAEEVVSKINSLGFEARAFYAELTKSQAAAALISECIFNFGGLDVLVNNAGITDDGLILKMGDEQFSRVISANLNSCFYCTREALSYMLKRRAGRIVNISSVVGLSGNAGQANYAASKAAIIGLTKSCAKEVASRNICVNAVAPGYIETGMTENLSEAVKARILERIPLARSGSEEDVAAAVSFLCSECASYITGQVLVVDGGMNI